jgi:hypothetical protein
MQKSWNDAYSGYSFDERPLGMILCGMRDGGWVYSRRLERITVKPDYMYREAGYERFTKSWK